MSTVAPGHPEESAGYSLKLKLYCSRAFTPTLYAVLQEFRARLLPLLSESNQSERSVKGQLAQESIRGHDMLSNLKRTKTKECEGHFFSPFFFFFKTAQYPSSVVVVHSSL